MFFPQVKDQQEAEKQKSHSQEIQKLVEIQKVEIATKKTEVMVDLDKVEPAVIDAQQAVKSIRKQHLVIYFKMVLSFKVII
jgi:dynein heavy chain 1